MQWFCLEGEDGLRHRIRRDSDGTLAMSVCLSTRLVKHRVDKRGLRKTAALSDPVLSLSSLLVDGWALGARRGALWACLGCAGHPTLRVGQRAIPHRGTNKQIDMTTRHLGSYICVRFDRREVYGFRKRWPGNSLPDRAVAFTFSAKNGDLVDCSHRMTGPEILALAEDAQRIGWLAVRSGLTHTYGDRT